MDRLQELKLKIDYLRSQLYSIGTPTLDDMRVQFEHEVPDFVLGLELLYKYEHEYERLLNEKHKKA